MYDIIYMYINMYVIHIHIPYCYWGEVNYIERMFGPHRRKRIAFPSFAACRRIKARPGLGKIGPG